MGAFDDLIPAAAPASGGGGAFDDLIPRPPPIIGEQRAAPEPQNLFGQALSGLLEPLAGAVTGMVAKPVSEVAGLAAGAREATPWAIGGDPLAFQQDVQRSMTYEPKTAAGMSRSNPLNFIPALIGQLLHGASQGASNLVAPPGSGPVREAVGRGVGEAVNQAPNFIAAGAPKVAEAAAPTLKEGARGLMQSALKPGEKAQRTGKAAQAVDTLLDEGVNVSGGGVDKLQGRVAELNDRIAQAIQASPAVVDKELVVSRLQKNLDEALNQVDPHADLATIQQKWENFLNNPGIPGLDIPVQQAQAMKQGTYQSLRKKYGEQGSAGVEADKSLARGLKEEIANVVPEVRPLNAEDSKLLNALSLTERRVMMEANKNPVGLGLLSIHPAHMAAWLADRSGLFKSLVARMLNTASEAAPTVGNLGPPLGMALNAQAQGIPPPPPMPGDRK